VRHFNIEKKQVVSRLAEPNPRCGTVASRFDRGGRGREIYARKFAQDGIVVYDENPQWLVQNKSPGGSSIVSGRHE
jgi:hypothetical protein